MEPREKRRNRFLSLNRTRKGKRMLLHKEKGKGEKIVPQKLQSSEKNAKMAKSEKVEKKAKGLEN